MLVVLRPEGADWLNPGIATLVRNGQSPCSLWMNGISLTGARTPTVRLVALPQGVVGAEYPGRLAPHPHRPPAQYALLQRYCRPDHGWRVREKADQIDDGQRLSAAGRCDLPTPPSSWRRDMCFPPASSGADS